MGINSSELQCLFIHAAVPICNSKGIMRSAEMNLCFIMPNYASTECFTVRFYFHYAGTNINCMTPISSWVRLLADCRLFSQCSIKAGCYTYGGCDISSNFVSNTILSPFLTLIGSRQSVISEIVVQSFPSAFFILVP